MSDYTIHPNGGGKIYNNATVEDSVYVGCNARISGKARIFGNARISGNAIIYGNAVISGNARIFGDAEIFGKARISGDAVIYGDAEIYGNARISGRVVSISGEVWTITNCWNGLYSVGCRIGDYAYHESRYNDHKYNGSLDQKQRDRVLSYLKIWEGESK